MHGSLNEYVYFFEHGVAETLKYFPALLQLIGEYLPQQGVSESTAVYFRNTCAYMREGPSKADFAELSLG
jgi:hypothetical protein